MKKRVWFGVTLVLLLGLAGGLYAWQPWSGTEATTGATGLGATYVVDRGNLSRSLTAYGEVLPRDEATFTFAEAKLKSLHVKLGDTVRAGDVLAVLDSTQEELALARAERALAQARADGVPTTIRERELEHDLARASFEETTVRAPFDGIVVEAGRTTGTTVGQYRIVVLDRGELLVKISLSETDVGQIRVGQRASVTLDAVQGSSWLAEIVEVGLRATQASGFGGGRVVSATARLLQPDERILPGFSARVEVVVAEARNVLRVPIEALVQYAAPPVVGQEQTASEERGEEGSRPPGVVTGVREFGAAEEHTEPLAQRPTQITERDTSSRVSDGTATTQSVATSRDWAVYVVEKGETGLRPVEIGLTTAQYAEVRGGLSEGDVIVRYPTSTRTSSAGATQRNVTLPDIFR
jgi:multidrug efflux pump subunit AcrA (membrane-fusion protein)